MKRLPALLLLMFMVIPVFSQEEEVAITMNEVSINLFTVKNKQVVDGGPSYYPFFFQGIQYRRKMENNLIRASLGYYQKVDELETAGMSSFGNFVQVDLGVGYQRLFLKKRVRPYVAADIVFQMARHDKENETTTDDFYEKYELRDIGLGLAPTLGLRFQVTNVLSFSLETSIQWILLRESGTLYRWEPNVLPLYEDIQSTGLKTHFNPLSAVLITLEF